MAEEPAGTLGSPDPSRSGPDIDAAVENAESDSLTEDVHHPAATGTETGDSRLEQMHEVDVTPDADADEHEAEGTTPSGPLPGEIGSGGAQRIVGARISDRVAGGDSAPDGPPFTTDSDD